MSTNNYLYGAFTREVIKSDNLLMKSIEQIRRENLQYLIIELFDGKQVKFANAMDIRQPNYVSRMVTGKKGIGDDMCRRIEALCDKPVNWMDNDHEYHQITNYSVNEPPSVYSNITTIMQYENVLGAMGNGIFLNDQPGQITKIEVTDEWLSKNLPANINKTKLCIVTGFGDSMLGKFKSGDPLLVDTGVTTLEYDSIYFFRIGNEGFIKHLQRIPGEGIRVISANKDYESWTIKPDMDFEIFARVVKVWQSTDF